MTESTQHASESAVPQDRTEIVIVEDETLFARSVAKALTRSGYTCVTLGNLAAARRHLKQTTPDLLMLDMRLPDGSGLDFLRELRENGPEVAVIVLTAFGDLDNAVTAMKLGALDYLKKPIDMDDLRHAVATCLERAELNRKLDYSRQRESVQHREIDILGESRAINDLRQQIRHLGELSTRTDQPPPTVLILGETGTGKDLVARTLHQHSARRDRPFVHVDCAALPAELIESELFGHEKGAFTGAHKGRSGLIEAAEDGTLFLDEIGELPLDLQTKLLAVLERRQVRRLGSTRERYTPAWFIAATNRSLPEMVDDGKFRSDLYYRLNIMTLQLPPLRERSEDVRILAEHYARAATERYNLPYHPLDENIVARLETYPWPGNVRELAHVMERAVLLSAGQAIEAGHLNLSTSTVSDQPSGATARDMRHLSLEQAEKMLIEQALEDTNGNVSEAARQLGVTRMILRHRIQKYGLK